jgi:hypothetical protein
MADIARVLYAVHMIVEKASKAAGLSRRATLALGVMSVDPETVDGKPGMTNRGLRERLLRYNLSSEQSVRKDASAAKTELLLSRDIVTEGSVATFVITAAGQEKLRLMKKATDAAVDETGLPDEERTLLRKLVGLPVPDRDSTASEGLEQLSASPRKPPVASKGGKKTSAHSTGPLATRRPRGSGA